MSAFSPPAILVLFHSRVIKGTRAERRGFTIPSTRFFVLFCCCSFYCCRCIVVFVVVVVVVSFVLCRLCRWCFVLLCFVFFFVSFRVVSFRFVSFLFGSFCFLFCFEKPNVAKRFCDWAVKLYCDQAYCKQILF